ncbi:hypothetical protein MTY_0692 [Moorella thermoacetica Y72]|uniref:Uncharacterized protein n=1 Tax=Moorella thermoacetica Y72 TaxID=1325331 RepID=A0A0S6UA95_NEOTH|nr:hypothetical protein MTY_0692 [Moorella thermoacetica Y72]
MEPITSGHHNPIPGGTLNFNHYTFSVAGTAQ